MKIAVVGAGAIGGLVAGYLKKKGEDVTLIARQDAAIAIKTQGLRISGVRGDAVVTIPVELVLRQKHDIVIFATKTQDLEDAFKRAAAFLADTSVVMIQNGIQAENIAAKHVPQDCLVSSIVMFGATHLEPGKIIHNFEGSWILGKSFSLDPDERLISTSLVLDKAFPTIISSDIKGMKYLKIFVNAGNCIPAVLGESLQEVFSDVEVSRISIAVWKEGFDVVSRAGIKLVSLPDFPLEKVARLVELPGKEAAMIFSGIMTKLSQDPVYGSILQSIMRQRTSEIDYINGEFVRIAERINLDAPLNRKLVAMVHEVERSRRFFTKNELLAQTKEYVK